MVGFSIARSLVITAANALFTALAHRLTKLEHHRSVTTFKKHRAAKLFFFQTLNCTVVVSSNFFAAQNPVIVVTRCYLDVMAVQLLTQLVSDVVLGTLLPLFLKAKFGFPKDKPAVSGAGPKTDDELIDADSQFDAFAEYQQLLARQFLMYYGFTVAPLIPVSALRLCAACPSGSFFLYFS